MLLHRVLWFRIAEGRCDVTGAEKEFFVLLNDADTSELLTVEHFHRLFALFHTQILHSFIVS